MLWVLLIIGMNTFTTDLLKSAVFEIYGPHWITEEELKRKLQQPVVSVYLQCVLIMVLFALRSPDYLQFCKRKSSMLDYPFNITHEVSSQVATCGYFYTNKDSLNRLFGESSNGCLKCCFCSLKLEPIVNIDSALNDMWKHHSKRSPKCFLAKFRRFLTEGHSFLPVLRDDFNRSRRAWNTFKPLLEDRMVSFTASFGFNEKLVRTAQLRYFILMGGKSGLPGDYISMIYEQCSSHDVILSTNGSALRLLLDASILINSFLNGLTQLGDQYRVPEPIRTEMGKDSGFHELSSESGRYEGNHAASSSSSSHLISDQSISVPGSSTSANHLSFDSNQHQLPHPHVLTTTNNNDELLSNITEQSSSVTTGCVHPHSDNVSACLSVYPCGDLIRCPNCIESIKSIGSVCPLCKVEIKAVLKCYI